MQPAAVPVVTDEIRWSATMGAAGNLQILHQTCAWICQPCLVQLPPGLSPEGHALGPPRKELCEQCLAPVKPCKDLLCTVCQACQLSMRGWEPYAAAPTEAWSLLTRLHGLLPSTQEQQYNPLPYAPNWLLYIVACRRKHFKHSFCTMEHERVWLIDLK